MFSKFNGQAAGNSASSIYKVCHVKIKLLVSLPVYIIYNVLQLKGKFIYCKLTLLLDFKKG